MKLLLGLAVAAVSAVAVVGFSAPAQSPDLAGSVVKLIDKTGHGSGVHIGGGYVLTAAHVPGGKKAMAYVRDDGKRGQAKVIWASPEYDVALMKLDAAEGLAESNLECRAPAKGETVLLEGNPLILEGITTWGRIAGGETSLGPWASVLPVDASIAGGMSGGGAFDVEGNLIGINVGAMVQSLGLGGTYVGLSLIVPGSTICGLLARDE